MPYPVGMEIVLPDGRTAVVSHVERDDPYMPSVRLPTPGGYVEERLDMRERVLAHAG